MKVIKTENLVKQYIQLYNEVSILNAALIANNNKTNIKFESIDPKIKIDPSHN